MIPEPIPIAADRYDVIVSWRPETPDDFVEVSHRPNGKRNFSQEHVFRGGAGELERTFEAGELLFSASTPGLLERATVTLARHQPRPKVPTVEQRLAALERSSDPQPASPAPAAAAVH